jgi:hypothetical protein
MLVITSVLNFELFPAKKILVMQVIHNFNDRFHYKVVIIIFRTFVLSIAHFGLFRSHRAPSSGGRWGIQEKIFSSRDLQYYIYY